MSDAKLVAEDIRQYLAYSLAEVLAYMCTKSNLNPSAIKQAALAHKHEAFAAQMEACEKAYLKVESILKKKIEALAKLIDRPKLLQFVHHTQRSNAPIIVKDGINFGSGDNLKTVKTSKSMHIKNYWLFTRGSRDLIDTICDAIPKESSPESTAQVLACSINDLFPSFERTLLQSLTSASI